MKAAMHATDVQAPERRRQSQETGGIDGPTRDRLERLAAYARAAAGRRGLTAGELAEDLADALRKIVGAEPLAGRPGAGLAQPFLEMLVAGFPDARQRIHIVCDPSLDLAATDLTAIGMIAAEAISNALAFAFPEDRDGDVWIRLSEVRGRIDLTIQDNGIGMPDTVGGRLSGRGFIETLADHLGGYARLGSAPFGGAKVSVLFPPRREPAL
jgi:signal transduction histidine kinase